MKVMSMRWASLACVAAMMIGGCSSDSGSNPPAGTGADASTGTDGTTGTTGTDGTDGTTGNEGTDGTTGSEGTDGTTGTAGTDGTTGSEGTDGTTGSEGTDGTTGNEGTDGTSGSEGTDGTTGNEGTDGTDGHNDSASCDGETAPTGALYDCACAEDDFCCDDWDSICLGVAIDYCGLQCTCDQLVPTCETTADCLPCDDDFDVCTGGYMCDAGKCVASDPITCTGNATGCVVDTCDNQTGECGSAPDDDKCADDQVCTADSCNEDGSCANDAIEGCGLNQPCKPADTPGSSDATITACVCAEDSYCCNNKWDLTCVGVATETCGLTCDCATQPAAELACETNVDCQWCGAYTPCGGGWACEANVCVAKDAVVCDQSANNGCLINTCGGEGECSLVATNSECDDDNLCTTDQCNEDGTCGSTPVEFCESNTCENRCGDYTSVASCQCDTECEVEGDCCEDLCTFCSADYPGQCGG